MCNSKELFRRPFALILLTIFCFATGRTYGQKAKEVSGNPVVILKGSTTLLSNTIFSSLLAYNTDLAAVTNNITGQRSPEFIQKIKGYKPSAIVLIGDAPVADIARNFPNIYVLAVDYYDIPAVRDIPNVIPLSTEIPIRDAVGIVKTLFPTRKRVGVLYNPRLTTYVTTEFKSELEKNALSLVSIKVETADDIFVSLKPLKGNIDLFYFIADATVFNPKVINTITSFLYENRIPYVTPSDAFLKDAGVVALSVDPVTTGRSVYRMIDRIVNEGKSKADMEPFAPRMLVTYSISNGKKFGIGADKVMDMFQDLTDKGFRVEMVE